MITRTGLLLALTLILQGLRLVIPVPPQGSMFVVGSLVNACLIVAALDIHYKAGLAVAVCTPVFAHLEGMLPLLPFIFPVALGNIVYVLAAVLLFKRHGLAGLCLGAVLKALVLYTSFYILFACVDFPLAVRHVILFVMSWPQVVTGVLGAALGYYIHYRKWYRQ